MAVIDNSKAKKPIAAINSLDSNLSADTYIGSNYADDIYAGGGNDILAGGNGDDILHGGAGNDTVWGDSIGGNDANDNGKDKLYGDAGNDELHGGNGKDEVYGGADNDKLYGENGVDYLDGGTGADLLNGGNADDLLLGGLGGDIEIGGNGADTFKVTTTSSSSTTNSPYSAGAAWTPAQYNVLGTSSWDVIVDFSGAGGEGDKIDLGQLNSFLAGGGPTHLTWSGTTASAHGVWTDADFLYADTSGDGNADMKIQVHGVGAGDFIGVNHAPTITSGTTGSIPENSPIATVAYDANATDSDGDAITYSLAVGGDNAFFTIDATTGVVTFLAPANFELPLDAGGNNVYDITVIAKDIYNAQTTKAVAIDVTDVNEQPDAGADFSASAPENVDDTTVLADVNATDPDVGGGNDATSNFEDLTYSITGGDPGGLFEIDAATGEISLASGQALDFETTQQYVLTVTATDGGGMSDTVDVTINVDDVNEAPTLTVDATPVSVAENVNDTTVIADVDGTDPDVGGGNDATSNFEDLTYSIQSGNLAGKFEIDALTGEITLATGATLDYETTQSYTLGVRVTDGGGLFDDETVTINVTDVNEQPNAGLDFTVSTPENIADTVVVADVNATDPDTLADLDADLTNDDFNDLVYSITAGNTGSKWEINAVNGEISLAAGQTLDYETDPHQYVLTVTVTDKNGTGLSDPVDVTINVTDVVEGGGGGGPPGGNPPSTPTFGLFQNGNSLAHIGNFLSTDPEGGTVTYTATVTALNGSDPTDITVATNGALSANGADPDTYTLVVTASDGFNSTSVTYKLWIGHTGGALADDTVSFSLSSDALIGFGEGGGDTITGTAAADFIFGGSSDDQIIGGGSGDTLQGGNGNDTFVYGALSNSVPPGDTIIDFTHNQDTIDVSAINSGDGGVGDFAWGGVVATAHGVWYTETATTTVLHFDTDGITATDEMAITLTGINKNLDAGDFNL